ncbi:MAG: hypothetical protein A2Z18_03560 [Armatimonadetes bacterium RBG_16_58_9]|nr:MAG: hypothetical protein A2Z18_03560 [Armatimonadetes bacterium RBG_16_58_9]
MTPATVTPQIVRAFLTAETESNSASTAAHSYVSLRAFFNFLVRDGFVAVNPADSVDKPRQRRKIIETFSLDDVERMVATCGKDFVGVRDRAMILAMLDCGLRASELCGLSINDVNWAEQTLLVVGKGDKERIVPFGNVTRQALAEYVPRRGQLETQMLFVSIYGAPLDRYRVRTMVKERCETAGIKGPRCSPHTLRHTCAVQYLRNGGDVFSLQKLLGHADLTMTRRYAELSQTDVREKHRACSPADRLQATASRSARRKLR